MNSSTASSSSDTGREGQQQHHHGTGNSRHGTSASGSSNISIDYVRDGALAAHRKMSGAGGLLTKLGLGGSGSSNTSPSTQRTSPEPSAPAALAVAAGARSSQTSTSPGSSGIGADGHHHHSSFASSSSATAASMATLHAEAASKVAMMATPNSRRGITGAAGVRVVPLVPAIVTGGPPTTRARKGSLRKNILQMKSMQRMETILSPRAVSQMSDRTDSSGGTSAASVASPSSPDTFFLDDDNYPTPRVSYDKGSRTLSTTTTGATDGQGGAKEIGGNAEKRTLHLDGGLGGLSAPTAPATLLLRQAAVRDSSTTDEDEKPPGSSSSNASSDLVMMAAAMKRPVFDAGSYFPPQPQPNVPGLRRRSPANKTTARTTKSSPLAAVPLDAANAAPLQSEAWDYAETEWWGWIILFVTWITFVVGMGSCFGAWSWAWDVGETPYAPPELEDDDTLPITGYYPALMVLTGVMAWVWVIIAWVGMKYFKHAKMSNEHG